MGPEVSIIITNHNYAHYLHRCIESCIHQVTHINYEIIIVDDGSTDNSLTIIENYINNNIHLVKINNSGIEVAANTGFNRAKGKWVVRVDADDFLLPKYLEKIMSQTESSKKYSFIYPDYITVDRYDRAFYEEHLPDFCSNEIISRGDFLATGTLYDKKAIQALNLYDTTIANCGLENYCLILRLVHSGHIGLHLSEPLFAYRRHGLNISEQKKEVIINFGQKMFSKLNLGIYRTNKYHPYRLEVGNR